MSNIPKKEAIVVLKNGVIAAWHPKKAFPYQHSRPIDLSTVKKEREVVALIFENLLWIFHSAFLGIVGAVK